MDFRLLCKMLGLVAALIGVTMVFSLPWSLPALGGQWEHESRGFYALLGAMAICFVVAGLLSYTGRGPQKHLFRKEAMAVVGLSWVLATLLGALPYLLCGTEYAPGRSMSPIDAMFEAQTAAGVRDVLFAWQGGEPTLMGLPFFERAVELAETHRGHHQHVQHTLQTNATKLDDTWGAFLKRHGFLVGVSLDGPERLHDRYRRDKGGQGSFAAVMRGVEVLRRHDVEWNALVTVHAGNAHAPLEVYRFLRDEAGARHVQFIPIVERINDALAEEKENGHEQA